MRYLISETQQNELCGRQEYLYDIFRAYFVPDGSCYGFIQLRPLDYEEDILFIVGHSDQIIKYLHDHINEVKETTIVVTTCFPRDLLRIKSNKSIYVPIIEDSFCRFYNGEPYGFKFKITDAELNLYNESGYIWNRIHAGYRLLRRRK